MRWEGGEECRGFLTATPPAAPEQLGGKGGAPPSPCEVGDRQGVPHPSPGTLKGRVPQPSIPGDPPLLWEKVGGSPHIGGTPGALHLWGPESQGGLSRGSLGVKQRGFPEVKEPQFLPALLGRRDSRAALRGASGFPCCWKNLHIWRGQGYVSRAEPS